MKPVKTTQRLLSYVLIYLVAMQPLLPAMAAAVSVASGNTSLDNAGNGVPIVNIATPNAAGISHNQYNDFNVGKSGLILNNGTARLNSTQLGGLIQNNPNLNGKAANAIINEVVSSNRSTLAGYLEVAGKQANVMVANPYGITCNGCGFINIPQVTLTTGKPQFDANGQLQALDVRDGNITITGQGLDASNSDYFSLIARTATLQAGLNAKDIRVVLGANRVGSDGSVTPQTPGSAAPTLALDTSVLGGMYANRIRLVSTENGVGVNTGNLGARSGDITLAANGELTVGNTVTQGNLQAQGSELTIQGKQQAQGHITLNGSRGITLGEGAMSAGQDITIASTGQILSIGSRISAGVSAQGDMKAGNQLRLKGENVTINHSQLVADQVALTATGHLQQDAAGVIRAGKTLRLGSASAELNGEGGGETLWLESGVLTGSGRWQASDDLSLSGVTQGDWSGSLLAGNVLDIRAGDLTNSGTLSGGQVSLHAGRWNNSGTISGRQLALTADSLINQGSLGAEKGVDLLVNGDLDNQGTLLAGDTLRLMASSLDNHGVINANQLHLHANNLINAGTLQAQEDADLTIDTLFNQTANGILLSGNMLTLQSGDLKTAGHLQAQQLQLDTGRWLNTADISLRDNGRITLAELDNHGSMLSKGDWQLTGERLSNQGSLQGDTLRLDATDILNSGHIQAAQDLALNARHSVTNDGDGLSGATLTLTAPSLDNGGTLQARQLVLSGQQLVNRGQLTGIDQLDMTLSDALDNQGMLGSNALMLSADHLTNAGTMTGIDRLNLSLNDELTNDGNINSNQLAVTGGSLSNSGTLLGVNGADVRLAGNLDNRGMIGSSAALAVQAAAVTQSGRMEGQTLDVRADSLDNSGTLLGLDALTLAIRDSARNTGKWLSQGDSRLRTTQLDNRGQWQADTMTANANTVTNAGQILGIKALTLTATDSLNNQMAGKLLTQGAAVLTANHLSNDGEWQAGNLTLQAEQFTNTGRVQSNGALDVTLSPYTAPEPVTSRLLGTSLLAQRRLSSAAPTGLFSNSGTVAVGGDSQFRVSQLDNQGTLAGSGDMNVRADQLDNSGNWLTQGSLSLDGNYQGGGLLQAGDTLSLHGDQLSNSGRWDSAVLVLNGGAFDNQGIVQAESGGTLNLTGALTTGADSHLLSNGLLTVQAGTFSQAGETGAGQLQVTTGSLDNRGRLVGLTELALNSSGSLINYHSGEILSNGTSALSAATLGNQGTINAADVRLRGTDITNQGNIQGSAALQLRADNSLINQTNGQILSGGNTGLNANQVDNSGWLQGNDLTLNAQQLTNAGTLKVQNALTLTVPQWLNSGTLQVGQADITADTIDNRGALLGLTRLALQANRITNVAGAKLYSAGDMSLKTGTLEQNGQLVALGNLQADILNPMRFASTLAAGGQLTLNVTGDLVQAGTLQGNGVTVTSSGNLTNQGNIVAGNGNSTLSAADITQTASGSIQTGNSLSLLSRGGISNQGFIGAAGDLLLRAGGLVNNTSLVYAGNNLRLFSDSLINRFGNILAGNNLWLQRDENGTANSSILNSSGSIETQRGDININTGNLTNQREGLVVTESNSSTADMPSWAGGTTAKIPFSWFKDDDLGIRVTNFMWGDHSERNQNDIVPYFDAHIQKVSVGNKTVSVSANGGEGKIVAGQNLSISSASLYNVASSILANKNISLKGNQLNNQSYQAGIISNYLNYEYNPRLSSNGESYYKRYIGPNLTPNNGETEAEFLLREPHIIEQVKGRYKDYGVNYISYELIGNPITEFTPGQNYNATIQAGGSITASFTNNISNTSLQPGSGSFIPAAAIPTLARVSSLGGLTQPGDRSLSTGNNDLSLSHSSTPTLELQPGVQAAAISVDPAHPFSNLSASDLITSINQGLQQLDQQTLTDYPLPSGNNGLFVVDPNSDSRYLIHSNPKLDQLGQVDSSLFSELQGMLNQTSTTQARMENHSQLTQANQFLGSSYLLGKLNLDADHDYRFLGDATFDTRYISNAVLDQTGQRYLNGLGSDLAQMQYLLDNAAQAQKSLNLQLGVSLTPDQVAGLSHSIVWWENITVNGQTVLAPKLYLAQADQSNLQGSSIVANSVSLSAGGAITNSGSTVKAVEALAIASGDKIENSEGGLLKSNGSLNLVSLGNLTNSSATIQGSNVTLASINGDIINTTTVNQWQTAAKDGRGNGSLARTDLGKTGSIVADNALTLQAGHDIQLNAGQLSAGQSMALSATNDITLNAAHTLKETVDTRGGGTSQNRTQGLVTSQLTSGGDLSLSTGRDLTSEAAGLNATGDMALSAGRDLNLLSATQEQYSGHWWDRHADWHQTISQQGTTLNAGHGLSLSAGNDINLQAAQAETNGALTAKAGNDINLLSATESQHDFFEETKVKKRLFSRSVTHNLQDTLQTTEKGTLLSSNSAALVSGHDINVQGSSVAAEGDVTLTAKNNVDISAATENRSHYQLSETKKSGLLGGGGLGFSIGKVSTKSQYDNAEVSQRDARSTVGTSNGNVNITAGKNIQIAGSDVIAARSSADTSPSAGNISLDAQNIAITPGRDMTSENSKTESKSSSFGLSLKGTPYDSFNNFKDISNAQGGTQQAHQYINEVGAMGGDTPQLVLSFNKSSSSQEQHSKGLYQIGSALTAAGNIQLNAHGNGQTDTTGKSTSGDIVVLGSSIHAGGDTSLDATRNIYVQSANETQTTSSQSSNNSWGLSSAIAGVGTLIRHVGGGPNNGAGMTPYASSRGDEIQTGDAVGQIASTISGNDVNLNSHLGDINVSGSAIIGTGNVLLNAAHGNVVVNAGQSSAKNETTGSNQKIGDLGGDGYSGTVGWQSSTYHSLDNVNQQSTLRSAIQSGLGDVSILADKDVHITGSDISAGGSVNLAGNNVLLDPSIDTEKRERDQQSQQFGVTTALSGYVVSALQAAEKVSQSVEDKKDPRLTAIYAAQAALDIATQTTATNMKSAAIKVTASVGGGSSHSKQEKNATTRQGATIAAANDVNISANHDIRGAGVDISGRNVTLDAGNMISLTAAQNEASLTGSSDSSHGGVGVGFGLGGQQNGFTIELSASGQKSTENGATLSNQNSHVTATDALSLNSGGDTTLKGTVLKGNSVRAKVGGNLAISSVQDTATYASKNTSAGINVSICVPPICAGQTVSGSANLSQQILSNNYASVREQSGIKAGVGGFDIWVGKHTQLDGAVLGSEASTDKNSLNTGTLGWRDIANISDYKGRGFGISVSTDSMPVGSLAQNKGKQTGITQSAVAPGTITVRDKAQLQDVTQLSRDTAEANNSVENGFNQQAVEDKLEMQKEAVALGVQAMGAYRSYKESEAEASARQRLTREGVPAEEMAARIRDSAEVKQVERDYAPGGSYWMAGTALTTALSGGLGGNMYGAVSGAAAPYLANLVKEVSGGNEPVRIALHTVLGAFLARAQGGSAVGGAAGGFTSAAAAGFIAKALYPDVAEGGLSAEQKQLVSNLAVIAGAGVGGLSGGNLISAGSGANTAKNEVENNFFAPPIPVVVGGEAAAMAGAVGQGVRQGGGNADDEDMGGSCEGTREQCAVRDGTRGPGHVLNGDGSSTDAQPNVSKNLSDQEKAELGGSGSGTPGGWGPQDEENARNQTDNQIGKWSIDELSDGAKHIDPASKKGDLTLAGRALQKHGSREGSSFPSAKGNPSAINEQGQKIVDSILNDPNKSVVRSNTGRYGQVTDVISSSGRGLRYDAQGKLIGFLEPPK